MKKSIKLFVILTVIIIITIILVLQGLNKNKIDDNSIVYGKSNIKEEITEIDEVEKKKVEEEIIGKLNKKYGNNNFKILNMKKGSRSGIDYDVIIDENYFDIDVQMQNSENEISFVVDYINKTDNLIEILESNYEDNILNRFKNINSKVHTIDYYLSDYNGTSDDSEEDYKSLDTIYNEIPKQNDIDLLVNSLHIYCGYEGEFKDEHEIENFINSVKLDIQELYLYIQLNFPRIPQGVSNTTVEINFGNGVVLRIYPLSKSLGVSQGNNYIEYEWQEILE